MTGVPLGLAFATAVPMSPQPIEIPPLLRDLDIANGCAADSGGWLAGATA